ncbi:MAG: MMPL family transporter, partial [Halobacteriales archaeon]
DALETLAANPNASVRSTFEAVDANTSVTLTEADYALFEERVQALRSRNAGNATADRGNGTVGNGTKATGANRTSNGTETGPAANATPHPTNRTAPNESILADEYAALEADRENVTTLDPSLDERIDHLESLNRTEIDDLAERTLSGNGRSADALALMPDHYDPGSSEANATLLVVVQETDGGSFAPGDAPEAIEDSQAAMAALAPENGRGSVLVYGDGIVSTEVLDSLTDSVLLVGPLAVAFVLLVLIVVYRDPLDILLGLFGIVLVLLWTFGTMGWFDIAFSQPFIVVLVLLIGLSIDYGLHVVMRYREERAAEDTSPSRAMAAGLGSVGVALVYVTATTVIGFLSNLTSPLSIFRDLGIVSAIGIVSTLVIFGVLVPALKVELDSFLESRGIDRALRAVGTGRGPVHRLLDVGATLARTVPYLVVAIAVLISAGGAYAATDVDSSFEQADFLAEDPADWLKDLPEPIAPGTYTSGRAMDALNSNFVRQDTTASILVRGDVTDPKTLDSLDAARENATDMAVTASYADGEAAIVDPITTMDRVAERNESFNATLSAADTDGDGVPDRNVSAVFDELLAASDDATDVIYREDGEYEALRMVVTVDGDADGADVVDGMDWVAEDVASDDTPAVATGDVVVNRITADELAETAILSLIVALGSVLIVLVIAYRITEGSATLGVLTVVPVGFTLTWVLGSMALLEIPFNIVTGMITGLTIGLGVDYSVHVTERFNQELDRLGSVSSALHETVIGTGGALFSSAATTASGFGVLLVAILPFLQSFGLITALTILFAFLASTFVLPSVLAIWARIAGHETAQPMDETGESVTASVSDDELAPHGRRAGRSIDRPYPLPDQAVPTTVTIRGIEGRVAVRERLPGEVERLEITPDPVAVDRDDQSVGVLWNVESSPTEATVSYAILPPEEAQDGDEINFEGVVDEGNDVYAVDGDETAIVVGDVFQRVIERGRVTNDDVAHAAEREEVSGPEFERLRDAWLDE